MVALAQVVLLAISLYYTARVVRDARDTRADEFLRHRELLSEQRKARKEEDERHAELLREQTAARVAEDERRRIESKKEAKRRREEATQGRQVDLERRLERVAERLADVEELRWQLLEAGKGQSALVRMRVALMRLRTAVMAAGKALPKSSAILDAPAEQLVPSADAISDALHEIEESLEILARASRIPWSSESE